jgi:hypothetical protein
VLKTIAKKFATLFGIRHLPESQSYLHTICCLNIILFHIHMYIGMACMALNWALLRWTCSHYLLRKVRFCDHWAEKEANYYDSFNLLNFELIPLRTIIWLPSEYLFAKPSILFKT